MRTKIITIICLIISNLVSAQNLSAPMENAIAACKGLSTAIATTSTSQLKAANKALKAADIIDFGDIWLVKGKELNVDGHFIFDEEFVDSLIVNRKIIDFSCKYAQKRSMRGSTGKTGRIKMTTRALKAGQKATWRTVNRKNAEYALVAEPGGLFTMTVYDDNGKILYAETINNKKGAAIRKVKMQLPDKATRVYLEIKNNSKKDASFAIIGN